jgi:hypothetical protein
VVRAPCLADALATGPVCEVFGVRGAYTHDQRAARRAVEDAGWLIPRVGERRAYPAWQAHGRTRKQFLRDEHEALSPATTIFVNFDEMVASDSYVQPELSLVIDGPLEVTGPSRLIDDYQPTGSRARPLDGPPVAPDLSGGSTPSPEESAQGVHPFRSDDIGTYSRSGTSLFRRSVSPRDPR